MIKPLVDLWNTLDFWLRQHIHWRRRGFRLATVKNRLLFDHLSSQEKDRALSISGRLLETYHLRSLENETSTGNYQENLFYLHMLEEGFQRAGIRAGHEIKAVDIGASHWFYVHALYSFLAWYQSGQPRNIQLDGYELDAYRVYADLYSRYDHALGHIGSLEGVHYHPERFTTQISVYDFAFMFFPFIHIHDHLGWGLPTTLFSPGELLQSAWDSLRPGGRLFIVNQGSDEHGHQLEMLAGHKIPVAIHFEMDPILFRYDLPRFITVSSPHA